MTEKAKAKNGRGRPPKHGKAKAGRIVYVRISPDIDARVNRFMNSTPMKVALVTLIEASLDDFLKKRNI